MLSLLLLALAAAGALLSIGQYRTNTIENGIAAGQIREMDDEIKRLTGEGQKVRQQLTPEQQDLLIASHKLVANKAFGWSRLFADLESVLPGNVSASRIVVRNVYKDGDRLKAELELGVLSRDYQAVIGMIANMSNSGLFQAEIRGQDLQQSDRSNYTEYTLRLVYSPAYGYSPAADTEVAQTGQGGAQ